MPGQCQIPRTESVVKWNKRNGASLLLLVIVVCSQAVVTSAQSWTTRDPRFYSREGVHDYNPPSPGDPDYRTYTFNDRRYGYYQPNGYGRQYPGQNTADQYPAGSPLGEDRFKYDPVSAGRGALATFITSNTSGNNGPIVGGNN